MDSKCSALDLLHFATSFFCFCMYAAVNTQLSNSGNKVSCKFITKTFRLGPLLDESYQNLKSLLCVWKQLKNSVGCLHARLVMTYRSSSLGQEETLRVSAWDVLLHSGEVSHNTAVLTGTLLRQFTEWCLQFFFSIFCFLNIALGTWFQFFVPLSRHQCTFSIQKEAWTTTKNIFWWDLNRCKKKVKKNKTQKGELCWNNKFTRRIVQNPKHRDKKIEMIEMFWCSNEVVFFPDVSILEVTWPVHFKRKLCFLFGHFSK